MKKILKKPVRKTLTFGRKPKGKCKATLSDIKEFLLAASPHKPPTSLDTLDEKKSLNAHRLNALLAEVNKAFKNIIQRHPSLLSALELCRENWKGDPYLSFYGSSPKDAWENSFSPTCHGRTVLILHLFGFSNVAGTISLAILPNNRIGLLISHNVSAMEFFYHTDVIVSEDHPVSCNSLLIDWLDQLAGEDELWLFVSFRLKEFLDLKKSV